ncbi:hypothetical protein [Actinokineospora cianjurensis]|uniref:Uncharacterized protein n=1 Tax=Actinokineospora cianjurensis TaxID=585224 RepID=A0A421AYE5_9PSEU|nr:hypothetical protein [Actinokineospora cianjurensis]RLK54838.1 hypothetical protein CLV68_5227 [Actinokineospora cianjurensis]
MPERQVPGSADVLTKPAVHDYRERHGIVVICRDSRHQEQVYAQLRGLGLRCRVVSV